MADRSTGIVSDEPPPGSTTAMRLVSVTIEAESKESSSMSSAEPGTDPDPAETEPDYRQAQEILDTWAVAIGASEIISDKTIRPGRHQ